MSEGRSLSLEEVWSSVHPNFRLRLQSSPLDTITLQVQASSGNLLPVWILSDTSFCSFSLSLSMSGASSVGSAFLHAPSLQNRGVHEACSAGGSAPSEVESPLDFLIRNLIIIALIILTLSVCVCVCTDRPVNYVLTWLSVVGPLVGLEVPLKYCTLLHPDACTDWSCTLFPSSWRHAEQRAALQTSMTGEGPGVDSYCLGKVSEQKHEGCEFHKMSS